MTDRDKQPIDEKTLSQWIQELQPRQADPAFRATLRADFVGGRLDEPAARPADRESFRPRLFWLRWVAPVAAAVVLLAVVFLNSGPALRVAAVTGAGDIVIDGHAVPVGELDLLNERVKSGVAVQVPPDATLDLVAKDVALYELVGGTQVTLPSTPGRWFNRVVACSLFVGELRVKTGSDFVGAALRVHTPDGMVVVTGTLLSIQCDSGGTCVCVLEGSASVGVDESDLEPIEPGFRKIMLRDGTVDIVPVKPMHRDGVLEFDRRVGHRIGGDE
ncbi:MAG: FecR domain-containing protein [Candidatus Latescibacterota bacterium]|nr:MAG: FecR domain-containing protein [Candidatus Latescibacterota bacterium]